MSDEALVEKAQAFAKIVSLFDELPALVANEIRSLVLDPRRLYQAQLVASGRAQEAQVLPPLLKNTKIITEEFLEEYYEPRLKLISIAVFAPGAGRLLQNATKSLMEAVDIMSTLFLKTYRPDNPGAGFVIQHNMLARLIDATSLESLHATRREIVEDYEGSRVRDEIATLVDKIDETVAGHELHLVPPSVQLGLAYADAREFWRVYVRELLKYAARLISAENSANALGASRDAVQATNTLWDLQRYTHQTALRLAGRIVYQQ